MKKIIVSLALVCGITMTACPGPGPGPGPVIGAAIVDCLGANRPQIDSLLGEFKSLLTQGRIDWSAVYARAKTAGRDIGGCALAEMVQFYLGGGMRADDTTNGWNAHMALEEFRHNEAGGATFKARCTTQAGTVAECKL